MTIPTYRIVDGARVPGVIRPIFIHNFQYHLTELKIFADGSIWCWEWVDLDGLREKLRSGWVVTEVPEGGQVSALHLGSWKVADGSFGLTHDMLLGEVADEIDRLNDRPDSTGRCKLALRRYLSSRAESDRLALREAYLAIPEHLRHYALGDMDNKDRPLVFLCTDIGEAPIGGWFADEVDAVTEEMRGWAFAYFGDRDRVEAEYDAKVPADDPATPVAGPVHLSETVFPKGWPDDPGRLVLRNEYPVPITVDSETYPTVVHAYWALSTSDLDVRARIRMVENPYQAMKLAETAPRVDGWPQIRTAVMMDLLRAKFGGNTELAETLLATGDAPIEYSGTGSDHWLHGARGRNWMGRLLELVRSELARDQPGRA
jgi:predicted NAD-dependent protein-ADP-ribosyltransferase YbiA (DUF1768 family)